MYTLAMSKGKILVVDDEAKIVDIVKAYLEKEGYQVTTAGDGSALREPRRLGAGGPWNSSSEKSPTSSSWT